MHLIRKRAYSLEYRIVFQGKFQYVLPLNKPASRHGELQVVVPIIIKRSILIERDFHVLRKTSTTGTTKTLSTENL